MKSSKLLPLSGVLGVVLVIASFAVPGETPDADASLDDVVSFYSDHADSVLLGAILLALGALFILIYAMTMATAIRRAEDEPGVASSLAIAGGALGAAGFLIFAGLMFTLGDVGDKLEPAAVQTLNALNEDLFLPAAIGTSAFLLGVGSGVVKTSILPTWLGWAAIVIAVIAVTPAGFFALPLFGLWVIVTAVMLSMGADSRSSATAGNG